MPDASHVTVFWRGEPFPVPEPVARTMGLHLAQMVGTLEVWRIIRATADYEIARLETADATPADSLGGVLELVAHGAPAGRSGGRGGLSKSAVIAANRWRENRPEPRGRFVGFGPVMVKERECQ